MKQVVPSLKTVQHSHYISTSQPPRPSQQNHIRKLPLLNNTVQHGSNYRIRIRWRHHRLAEERVTSHPGDCQRLCRPYPRHRRSGLPVRCCPVSQSLHGTANMRCCVLTSFVMYSGAVHGGSKSSESHDHITVRFTTIDEQRYDAHIAVDGHYGIDYKKCQLWKR